MVVVGVGVGGQGFVWSEWVGVGSFAAFVFDRSALIGVDEEGVEVGGVGVVGVVVWAGRAYRLLACSAF